MMKNIKFKISNNRNLVIKEDGNKNKSKEKI